MKHGGKTNEKVKKRRMVWFSFVGGILVGLIISFSFFIFYQMPKEEEEKESVASSYEIKLDSKDRRIKQLRKQLRKYEKVLKLAEKERPRMVFGQKNVKTAFPNLAMTLENELKSKQFIGTALVIKNNQIVLEKGFGYADKEQGFLNNSNTTYMIGSIQKAITASMVMKLIEEEKLSLDTTLDTFYPKIEYSDKITIRQMLDMTTGLSLKGEITGGNTEKEVIDKVVNQVISKQTTKWEYSAVNYILLAGIIRTLAKEDYQEYVNEAVIQKLNLNHTGFYDTYLGNQESSLSYVKKGKPYEKLDEISLKQYQTELGTGNMFMSVGDMATFYQGLDDGKIISKKSLESLRTPGTITGGSNYAGGNYIKKDYLTSHGVLGGFETYIALTLDGSTGVILFSNQQAGEINIPKIAGDLYNQLIKN